MYVISNNELYHYGVLGMKWGVRRYQSYAEKPRKSGKGGKEIGAAKKKSAPSHEELVKSKDPYELYENRDQLSDQELRDALNRLNMEKNLKSYTKKEKSEARKLVENAVKSVATTLLIAKITDVVKNHNPISLILNALFRNKISDMDDDISSFFLTGNLENRSPKEVKKLTKQAKKDAVEYAKAQAAMGEGSGRRRKAIKAVVEEHSKDPDYKELFDRFLEEQDKAKNAKKAQMAYDVKETAKTTKKAAKNTFNFLNTVTKFM